jgi:chromosome segregation ATPase
LVLNDNNITYLILLIYIILLYYITMSDRTLRPEARRIAEARRAIRSRMGTISERITELTQAMPLLMRLLDNLTADIELATENKERINERLMSLVDEESAIIERIKRDVEQSPIWQQYMELNARYQRYIALENSSIDSLRMMLRMVNAYRKAMDDQIDQAFINNATTEINTQISLAEVEYRKANDKFYSLDQEKRTLMTLIGNNESELAELHRQSNDLNIQLARARGPTRRKQKGTKKGTKKGGKWSLKYKRSINCRRPKGFSQKQYCKY